MYTFSFIVGNIIPKSVKCIHSATKYNNTQKRTTSYTARAQEVNSRAHDARCQLGDGSWRSHSRKVVAVWALESYAAAEAASPEGNARPRGVAVPAARGALQALHCAILQVPGNMTSSGHQCPESAISQADGTHP